MVEEETGSSIAYHFASRAKPCCQKRGYASQSLNALGSQCGPMSEVHAIVMDRMAALQDTHSVVHS